MSLSKPYFPPFLGFDYGDDNEELISSFVENSKSKETLRKSDQCVRKFKAFVEASGTSSPIENLEKKDINQLLCTLLIQLKKEDGSNYEINSMKTMFSMLGGFVKRIGRGNVEEDHEYVGFRDVKKAKVKVLKADGKGIIDPFTRPTSPMKKKKSCVKQAKWALKVRSPYRGRCGGTPHFCLDIADDKNLGNCSGATCF